MSLDAKIRALSYDENSLLAYKELGLSNYPKIEGRHENNDYILVERKEDAYKDPIFDFGVVESIIDRTFPGSLLKANSRLVDNNPDILTTARKPMRFRVDLPGMEEDAEFTVDPTYIDVSTGINKVLNNWNNNYSGENELVTKIQYSETMAYSQSQLNAKFGMHMKKLGKELDINFDSIFKKESTVLVAEFKQIFYTVSANIPSKPSEVFSDVLTWEELENCGVDSNNPPALVNKVSYGRAIYVKIESSSSSDKVEDALKASMGSGDINTNLKADYSEILKNSNFTVVVIGGGVKGHIDVINCKSLEDVRKIILHNSRLSSENPGFPLFYNTIFLKDNKNAKISNYVEYIKTTCKRFNSGLLCLKHTGAYVIQYEIHWHEFNYNDGVKTTRKVEWGYNYKDRTASFSTEIPLSGNCENIRIYAKGCTGLAWEWWRVIVDRHNLHLVPKRVLETYGTTLKQKYKLTEE